MAEPEPARHAQPLHDPDVDNGGIGRSLRDIILGGQDGLVNVLGLVLGVAAATAQLRIILAAALAATFSESIARGGVMYTTLIGSLIPLVPFLFVPLFGLSVTAATIMAVPLCAVVLFGVGAYKALTLVGDWRISGLQMTVIGMVSAAAGYGIGRLLHVSGA